MMEGLHRKVIILAVGAVALAAILFGFSGNRKPRPAKRPAVRNAPPAAEACAASPAAANTSGANTPATNAAAAGTPGTAAPAAEMSAERRRKQEAVLSKPCGRDPFVLSSGGGWQPDDVSLLQLKGISVKEGVEPMALIGDAVVRVGDRIGGAQVLEIHRDGVRLRKGTREYTLKLEGAR
jgi:hypothetical protein